MVSCEKLAIFSGMKRLLLSSFLGLFFSLAAMAQHPLEGTWEMVSITGVNADGEKFFLDTTTVRETKIITSTHYMLLARDKDNQTWTFNRCYAGTVKMEGQKYYEMPVMSSLRIFENVITDFTWKLEGERFIQAGTITRPDGKKIILEEFIFRRLKGGAGKVPKDLVGTWSLEGSKSDQGLLIITPTHWMKIIKDGEKLDIASGGEISAEKGKTSLITSFQSGDVAIPPQPIQLNGKKITVNGAVFVKI
jgi:hypothetical protein